MSTHDYVRPGGQWANEMVPGAADAQRLDAAQADSVNFTAGGLWTPTKQPIWVGGAGLASSASGTLMSGGVYTLTGGGLIMGTAAGFPTLSPSRSRQIRIPVLSIIQDLTVSPSDPTVVLDDVHGWGVMGNSSGPGNCYVAIPGLSMHVGARIASVGVTFRITKKPTSLPTGTPFNVTLISTDDNGTVPFSSLGAQVNPFVLSNMLTWFQPNTPALGSYIRSSAATNDPRNTFSSAGDASGVYFKCTTSGAVGGSEPTWPAGPVGTTVNDGAAVWTLVGRDGFVGFKNATLDSYQNSGAPVTVAWDFDGTTGTGVTNTNIVDVARRYYLGITDFDSDNGMIVTGAFIDFDSITSMSPA